MRTIRSISLAPLFLAATSLAACAVDGTGAPGEPAESTAESSAALNNVGGATIQSPTTDFKLGPTSQQTCFLQGVGGDFVGNPAFYENPKAYDAASAGVHAESDGYWHIRLKPGTGTGVSASAICVAQTANRVAFSWSDNITSEGVPATANRRCFLQSVWATSGLTRYGNGLTPKLAVEKVGGSWDMNGSFVSGFGGDMEFGGATAVCVDMPAGAEWDWAWGLPQYQSKTATLTTPVSGSIACGLTSIGGDWIWRAPASNPGETDPWGNWDGVFLDSWNWSLNKPLADWTITASDDRGGTAVCLQ